MLESSVEEEKLSKPSTSNIILRYTAINELISTVIANFVRFRVLLGFTNYFI